MGLIELPGKGFGSLVLLNRRLDHSHTAIAREEMAQVAGQISVHSLQQDAFDRNGFLPFVVRL